MKTKSNSVITVTLDGNMQKFNVLGAGELVLDLSKLAEAIRVRAMAHGMKQRISDAAAIPCDKDTGLPATPEEKLEAMRRLVEHYMTGSAEWSPARTSGGGATKDTSGITLQAMKRVWPDKDCEGLAFKLETKRGITRREAYAEFAKTKEVMEAIAAIKAEHSTVSADDLLDEMESDDE
jgi:hypothetical protein